MALASLAAALAGPQISALRLITLEGRTALRVVLSEPVAQADVYREGGDLVVVVAARPAPGLAVPEPRPPLEAIRVEADAAGARLRLRVPEAVPHELSQEEGLLTLLVGERGTLEAQPRLTADLYQLLFPFAPSEGDPFAERGDEPPRDAEPGLRFGPFGLRPGLQVTYSDAEVAAFDRPGTLRSRYLQVEPMLAASTLLGRFNFGYHPRFRALSTVPQVSGTTHRATAGLQQPLGPRLETRASHEYVTGILETDEVDPGGEYFFALGRFHRHQTSVGGRFDLGPFVFAHASAGWQRVRFSEDAAFFGYRRRTQSAGLGYELTPALELRLVYGREHVPPPPDRPLAETTAHSVSAALDGTITPLLSGRASVGWRVQSSPRGPEEGRRFRGLTTSGALTRALGPASSLELRFGRATQLSAFEDNPYYVSSSGQAALSLPVPFQVSLRAAAGYQRNSYPTIATATGEPRSDTIFGWAVGLGRGLGHRAHVRADYRRDRRRSSLPGFDLTTDALVIQVGIGHIAEPARR